MRSFPIDVFLSMSFDTSDVEINNFFSAICAGLDITVRNVSYGAKELPSEQARKLISRSAGLIAICPVREELADGTYNMPQAVNDEIAIAHALQKPVLVIVENGVNKRGFSEKFKTYHSFDRNCLHQTECLRELIRAIHEFKVELIDSTEFSSAHGPTDSHAEFVHHLVELKCLDGEFTWEHSTTKKITYTKDSIVAFPTSVFATQDISIPENAEPIAWNYEHVESSRSLRLVPTIEQQTAARVDVRLMPEPPAEDGDSITYRTFARSKYLLPLWQDQVKDNGKVYLSKGEFHASEGLLFIHRTKKAIIEFRICRQYAISRRDIVPFVASFTSAIDFEVESELERARVRIEDMGGLTVRMEIDSALPGHIYGIAWNPLPRPNEWNKNVLIEEQPAFFATDPGGQD